LNRRDAAGDAGFSMVEMMVSILVIAIVATASVAFFVANLRGVNNQRQHQEAVYLADQQLETVESLPVAMLVHGRPKSAVQTLYASAAATALGISSQDDVISNSNWDASATSLTNVTVPLTSTQTVNNVAYNMTTFIDACYYSSSTGVCGPTSSSSTNQEYRVSLYETWTSSGACATAGNCSYSTRTLIDPTADPTFSSTITVPNVAAPSPSTINTDNAYTDSCTTAAGTAAGTEIKVTASGSPSNLNAGVRVKIGPGGGTVSEISQVGSSEVDFCLTSGDTPGVYSISIINTDGGNTPLSITEVGNISQATGWDPTTKTLTLYGGGFETGTTLSATGAASWTGYTVYNCSTTVTAPCSAGGSPDEVVINGFNGIANGAASTLTLTNPDSTMTYALTAPKMGTLSKSAVAVNQTTNLSITSATGFQNPPNTLNAVVTSGNGTATVTYTSASTATLTVSPTATGTMTVYLYNDDGGKTNTFNIGVDPQPTVSAANPNSVPVSTTKTVTVTGTGFLAGMSAASNNGTVSVSSVTATTVTLSVKASSTGTDTITLTNTDGGTVSFNLTVKPLPTISALSPATGTHSTLTTFTITGANFVSGATVAVVYNGSTVSPAPAVTFVSASSLKFKITLNSTGSSTNVPIKVTVTNPDGGVSTQFSTNVKQS
jgi:prepilin-type N-terminal cleavage/methylation domain-containing protein